MWEKIFSKATFVTAGITYLLIAVAYAVGYLTYSGGGWFSFGPVFSGLMMAAFSIPVIVILSIIGIAVRRKQVAHVLGGYFHDEFSVLHSSIGIYVNIFKQPNSIDEARETEIWQNFITQYDINTKLIEIVVSYRAGNRARSYNVSQDRWWGGFF